MGAPSPQEPVKSEARFADEKTRLREVISQTLGRPVKRVEAQARSSTRSDLPHAKRHLRGMAGVLYFVGS
jgi:hypothetical protein